MEAGQSAGGGGESQGECRSENRTSAETQQQGPARGCRGCSRGAHSWLPMFAGWLGSGALPTVSWEPVRRAVLAQLVRPSWTRGAFCCPSVTSHTDSGTCRWHLSQAVSYTHLTLPTTT